MERSDWRPLPCRLLVLLVAVALLQVFVAASEEGPETVKVGAAAAAAAVSSEALEDAPAKSKLALPRGGDADVTGTRKLEVGGTIKMDELGPIILNEDGSMRRIVNWDILTPHEREWTHKRIAKRNEERKQALQAKARVAAEALAKEGRGGGGGGGTTQPSGATSLRQAAWRPQAPPREGS
mmetsp:Transcript_55111/g.178527  ORF Transcript_55111/g.178527 Transcript_55111/m.178527 type:complete len:181 (+) Transcript_55111:66-608(+)